MVGRDARAVGSNACAGGARLSWHTGRAAQKRESTARSSSSVRSEKNSASPGRGDSHCTALSPSRARAKQTAEMSARARAATRRPLGSAIVTYRPRGRPGRVRAPGGKTRAGPSLCPFRLDAVCLERARNDGWAQKKKTAVWIKGEGGWCVVFGEREGARRARGVEQVRRRGGGACRSGTIQPVALAPRHQRTTSVQFLASERPHRPRRDVHTTPFARAPQYVLKRQRHHPTRPLSVEFLPRKHEGAPPCSDPLLPFLARVSVAAQ